MESVAGWQVISLCGVAFWIMISSILDVTQKIRSLTQPWVSRCALSGTPFILKIQKYRHSYLDSLFSGLSCVVSVPFYTAFLPLLFWDVVSAPRPSSPPVRRVTATRDEEENAWNMACLLLTLLILFACQGRIYLGMHSLIDIIGGLAIGLGILAIWLPASEYIENFIIDGQNVVSFWCTLSFLLLLAYPTPELPTPSFEYHTAFTGVALGVVIGVHQTFRQFHHENVARVFSHQLTFPAFLGRILLGLPTILLVKYCSKALARWILPILANTLGIPVRSTSYVPALNGIPAGKKSGEIKLGYLHRVLFVSNQTSSDVDTGIRLLQYTGLAWSVVDLVPSVFSHLRL